MSPPAPCGDGKRYLDDGVGIIGDTYLCPACFLLLLRLHSKAARIAAEEEAKAASKGCR